MAHEWSDIIPRGLLQALEADNINDWDRTRWRRQKDILFINTICTYWHVLFSFWFKRRHYSDETMKSNPFLLDCRWPCQSARRWNSSSSPVSGPLIGWNWRHLSRLRGSRTVAGRTTQSKDCRCLGSEYLWGSAHVEKIALLCHSTV